MVRKLYALSIILVLVLSACASTSSSSGSSGGGASAIRTNTQEVKISDFDFSPVTLTISQGTTVKWTNNDSADHTVTADDKSFDSGSISQGKSYSFTFNKEGTYTYICSFHPTMTAKVIVTK